RPLLLLPQTAAPASAKRAWAACGAPGAVWHGPIVSPSGIASRGLHHPGAERREIDAQMGRLLRQERQRCQSRLRVDLQQIKTGGTVGRIVVPEIAAGRAAAA